MTVNKVGSHCPDGIKDRFRKAKFFDCKSMPLHAKPPEKRAPETPAGTSLAAATVARTWICCSRSPPMGAIPVSAPSNGSSSPRGFRITATNVPRVINAVKSQPTHGISIGSKIADDVWNALIKFVVGDVKTAVPIAVPRNVATDTKDRRLNRAIPQTPCPVVQPDPSVVPKATRNPPSTYAAIDGMGILGSWYSLVSCVTEAG